MREGKERSNMKAPSDTPAPAPPASAKAETRYWLCYVSDQRACGPVEVLPNLTAREPDDISWYPAAPDVEDKGVVCSANLRDAEARIGTYRDKTSGRCYFITDDRDWALVWIAGAKVARSAIAIVTAYDHGGKLYEATSWERDEARRKFAAFLDGDEKDGEDDDG